MGKARIVGSAAAAFLLSACSLVDDNRFRNQGAGSDLPYTGMRAEAVALNAYLDKICIDADIALTGAPPRCDTSQLAGTQWRALVQAGYNDIDARCDAYLSWLEAKRGERSLVNTGVAALTALLGGILVGTGSTEALAYVALALGFGATVYSAYHESVLLGLEQSTIKTIVIERRLRFRTEFRAAEIASKPDAVYTLRSYLRICTPATITLDVNTYTRDAILGGRPADDQQRRLELQRQALSSYRPVTPDTPANVTRQRGSLTPVPGTERIFSGLTGTRARLLTLQAAFCIPEAMRGRVDDRTIANVNLAMSGSEERPASSSFRIGADDFARIVNATGGGRCDTNRYRNVYENTQFRADPGSEPTRLAAMKAVVPEFTPSAPTALSNPEARRLVGLARERCGLGNSGPFAGQVTPDLLERLVGGRCAR